MATATPLKTPTRFLFIASIGNPKPYLQTRHSAGHVLLDAVEPLLSPRIPFITKSPPHAPAFYETWRSPSLMNVAGNNLTRKLKDWLYAQNRTFQTSVRPGDITVHASEETPSKWDRRGVDPGSLTHFRPTLVILHDELEEPLGKIKVRRGGPEKASLRGHRGLISVMESLRRGKLHPPGGNEVGGRLAIMRVGVGIGRPLSRERGSVSEYVLSKMDERELDAVSGAAGFVVKLLEDEFYRAGDGL